MNDTVITLQWNEPPKEPLKEDEIALLFPENPVTQPMIEMGFHWIFKDRVFRKPEGDYCFEYKLTEIIAWAYSGLDKSVDLQTGQLIE